MKKYITIVVILALISKSECGLIDGLFDMVKNTTHAIKDDISGVVNFGKDAVFGPNNPTTSTKYEVTDKNIKGVGLFDKISVKMHNVAAGVREHVRSAISIFDEDKDGNGLIGRMCVRMKNRINKVHGYFFGDHSKQSSINQNVTRSPNVANLSEKLKQYVFKKNSTSGSGIHKTLYSLKDVLEKLRNNATAHNKKENNDEKTDGAGLLDIRMLPQNMDQFNNEKDATYKNIEDQILGIREKAETSIDELKQNSNNFIENQKNNVQKNYDTIRNNTSDFGYDAAKRVNNIENSIKSSDGDVTKLTNGYNAVD